MKKIALALMCLSLLGLSVFAQTSRKTRPRIVRTPKPTPKPTVKAKPTLKGDTAARDAAKKKAPVLIDNTSTKSPTSDLPPPPPLQTEPVEDDEIIKIETNLVTLPVTVLDRNGRFISGIQQREFKIYEDGAPQKIEYFASVEKPFTVVLLLDVSPSTQYKINEIQDAAISFVNQLRPADRVMVVAFDQTYKILTYPTNDRFRLRSAIRQANFGSGTSLYDAVSITINRELRNVGGRKAIVLFTDGVDTTSRRSNYESTLRQVEEVDAMLYPIRYDTFEGYAGGGKPRRSPPTTRRNPPPRTGNILIDILGGIMSRTGGIQIPSGGAGTSAEEYARGKRYLGELASYSGGRIFEADSIYNLDAAFRSIAEELRRQYSIGYYPEKTGEAGDRRSIRVRVMRPSLVVRTKRSYIVGSGYQRGT